MRERVTMYLQGLWGYERTEIQDVSWNTVRHAQHADAIRIEYTERGKRKPQVIVITDSRGLVLLDEWDHPLPPATFVPGDEKDALVRVKQTKRVSCDPEWDREFQALLDGYLAGSHATHVRVRIISSRRATSAEITQYSE